MKLTFKDLKQKKWSLEFGPEKTVLELKQKLAIDNDWEVERIKLIYSGKILQNERIIKSYNVEEKGFIVCMLSKPLKTTTTTSTTTSISTPSTSSISTPSAPKRNSLSNENNSTPIKSNKSISETSSTSVTSNTNSSNTNSSDKNSSDKNSSNTNSSDINSSDINSSNNLFNDPSTFSVGSARKKAIDSMVEMGYPVEQAEKAMRAAYNNPDRAVDYLLNGIPENNEISESTQDANTFDRNFTNLDQTIIEQQGEISETNINENPSTDSIDVDLFDAAAQLNNDGTSRTTNSRSRNIRNSNLNVNTTNRSVRQNNNNNSNSSSNVVSTEHLASTLSLLRSDPQFANIRNIIGERPELMRGIVQSIASSHPQLASSLAENPEAFFNILANDTDEDANQTGMDVGDVGDVGMDATTDGSMRINVTSEESAAIDRLCGLGFHREIVIQAYFACEKNEEMAANYLFDHGHEDDN